MVERVASNSEGFGVQMLVGGGVDFAHHLSRADKFSTNLLRKPTVGCPVDRPAPPLPLS